MSAKNASVWMVMYSYPEEEEVFLSVHRTKAGAEEVCRQCNASRKLERGEYYIHEEKLEE